MRVVVNAIGRRMGLTKALGISHELLQRLYWDERMSVKEIAERYGVGRQLVSYWLRKFRVEPRAFKAHYRPSSVCVLTEYERGWITGLLDGEGYLSWVKHKKYRPSPALGIVNTNYRLLVRVRKVVGTGRIEVNHEATEDRKTLYCFKITRSREIAALLEQILPGLVIKKAKAQQMLGTIWMRISASEGLSR